MFKEKEYNWWILNDYTSYIFLIYKLKEIASGTGDEEIVWSL